MVFLYGYLYAQHLVVLAIVLIFSITVPLVTVCGVLFFCCRHGIDSYTLLTVNRKELDSESKMFRKILLSA
jgi:hypothetical protein